MKKIINNRDLLLIGLFAVFTFLGSLVLLRVSDIYVSPDETANAFFAEQFARTGNLAVFDPLNVVFDDALHPRSTVSLNGWLVPGGFIGLPVIYGVLTSFFGNWILGFLTPLIAVVALFAWYGLTKKLFDREIAVISTTLLSVTPAWWYYSARSLMPNVPFVALLICAGYFLIARPLQNKKYKEVDLVASGLLAGLALSIRPSEIIWLGLASLAAVYWYRSKFSFRSISLFCISLLIALLPMFVLNQATYGSPFTTGYTVSKNSVSSTDSEISSISPSSISPVSTNRNFLFPFGLSRTATITNVFSYGLGMFWWIALLAIIGLPLLFPAKASMTEVRNGRKSYLTFAAVATVYLAILYGSWTFYDNPDQSQVTIANSHVRYWLPIFVLATPAVAYAIQWVSRRAFTPLARSLSLSSLVLLCVGVSIRVVFFSAQDGLVYAAQGLVESREIHEHALTLIEPDAVVIVDRGDKLFFPDRRVLYPLREESTYALMPRIALRVPLYYYGITLPEKDIQWLNQEKLASLGLRIDAVETFDIETLYRISKSD